MVIFRKISNIVLLLATFLLLVNSVLPHHHHHEEVCFEATHCESESADHHDAESGHNDINHDHHNDQTDVCQIVNFYLTPLSKNLIEKAKSKSFNKDQYLNSLLFSNEIVQVYLSYSSENILISDIIDLNTKCLTRALRAPPYC